MRFRRNALHGPRVLATDDSTRLDAPAGGPEQQPTGPRAPHTAWSCRCRSVTTSRGLPCPIHGDHTEMSRLWACGCVVVPTRRAPQTGYQSEG